MNLARQLKNSVHIPLFLADGNLNTEVVQENAEVFLKYGNAQIARKMFYRILDDGNQFTRTHLGIGRSFEQEGRLKDAQRHYDLAFQLKGSSFELREAIERSAAIQFKIGDTSGALRTLLNAKTLKLPEHVRIRHILFSVECLIKTGNANEACDAIGSLFQQYSLSSRARSKAFYYLGKIAIERNEFKKSEKYFSLSLANDRHNYKALGGLAEISFLKQLHKHSAEFLLQSLSIKIDQPKLILKLLKISTLISLDERAISTLKNFYYLYPNHYKILYGISAILFNEGRNLEAINCLNKALKINPDFMPTKRLLKRLNKRLMEVD